MRKLLVGIVVLAVASMASAAGLSITSGKDLMTLEPGDVVDIAVNINGGVAVAGLNGYLSVAEPMLLSNTAIGSFWGANYTPPSIFEGSDSGSSVVVFVVTTASGSITGSGPLFTAKLTVNAPVGTTGTITTEFPGGVPSDLGDQGVEGGAAQFRVIPEPATALLLLAAVPFMRRRA